MGKPIRKLNSKGIALIEILIVADIFGVVLAAMATMMDSQRRETRALTEKLAALDFQRTLTTVLTVPSACASIVNATNLASGSTLQFNPAAITSTDPAEPTIIAGLNKIFSSDGVSVLADTAAASQVSPLARTVVLDPTSGVRVGGYRSGANVNYVLSVNFQNSSLVRPMRNLSFPLIVTTTPAGSDLRITGCQGAASASGDNGALCGQRTVFCKGSGAVYDGFDPGMSGTSWKSDNIPCQGTSLTATCGNPSDPYGYGNSRVLSVNGCPPGYTGAQTQVACTDGGNWTMGGPQGVGNCGSTNAWAVANIYCRKN